MKIYFSEILLYVALFFAFGYLKYDFSF